MSAPAARLSRDVTIRAAFFFAGVSFWQKEMPILFCFTKILAAFIILAFF